MYYSLSEAYAIRNELKASFLIRVDKVINKDRTGLGTFNIPPFMGYILAHIGDYEYARSVREIGRILNVSVKAINKFIKQLVDNSECKEFFIDKNHSVVFPPFLLVKSETKAGANVYEESGFNGSGDYEIMRPSFPTNVNLMVTTACTTDCIYCYANRKIGPLLPTKKILSLLDELHEQGTINVTLTGGDIFAHKDWPAILKHTRSLGYKPFLSTKTPININQIELLKELGYEEIQFSLDSVNPSVLEKMIKMGPSYIDSVSAFFKNCSDVGLNVLVRSVLTKLNSSIENISEMYHFLSSFNCVKEWVMTPAFFSRYKKKEYDLIKVDNKDLISVYEFSRNKNLNFPVGLNKISKEGYELKIYKNVEDYVCKNQICLGNTTCLSILANGNCSVCEMLYDDPEYLLGNVSQSSIKNIWNSKNALNLYFINQGEINIESPCSECKVFNKCRQDFGKRVCYLDIAKSGMSKHFPDPRCPMANDVDLLL